MRKRYDEQLEQLNVMVEQMGAMCENAIANGAKAFIDGDLELADRAIEIEQGIDKMEREIEALCLKLLLQQQPVATDLRKISSALKLISDMERIGDQAADISEIAKEEYEHVHEGDATLAEMARAVITMVTNCVHSFVTRDLALAAQVIEYDDVVDGLFNRVKDEVSHMFRREDSSGERAVDLILVAKYFERIGDHATNIAEWVEYMITGSHR